MCQQTQVKTVIPYYLRFMQAFPSLKHLADAEQQAVLKVWEGLGYYGRARNLHRAARIVAQDFDGSLPRDWKTIRRLPGVGDYIAAAVLSIAFDRPYAVVDGNVKRVTARLFKIDAPVNQSASTHCFKSAADRLLDLESPGQFNQALMELGALICKPSTPACSECPLAPYCLALGSSAVTMYPQSVKRKPVPTYHIALGVVCKKEKVLITQRPQNGLLGGLWEFPGGKILSGETPEAACVRELKEEVDLNVGIRQFLMRVHHAYTHFKIRAEVFVCDYLSGRVTLNGPVDHRWVDVEDIEQYPFPKANRKFIPRLREVLKASPE